MPRTIRELALEEMRRPVGAYDVVMPNGEHPLAHLVKDETPSKRSNTMPNQFGTMGGGNLAQAVRQRYGADDDPAEMDATTLLGFVRMCLDAFNNDPEERAKFLSGVSDLVNLEASGGAQDARRSRSRRRPAQDSALDTQSYYKRFPDAKNIKYAGHGRY